MTLARHASVLDKNGIVDQMWGSFRWSRLGPTVVPGFLTGADIERSSQIGKVLVATQDEWDRDSSEEDEDFDDVDAFSDEHDNDLVRPKQLTFVGLTNFFLHSDWTKVKHLMMV